jgi:hypothetical protein
LTELTNDIRTSAGVGEVVEDRVPQQHDVGHGDLPLCTTQLPEKTLKSDRSVP